MVRKVLLEEFIIEIKNYKNLTFHREFIYTYLNLFTEMSKWTYIIRLLISGKKGILTKQYFLSKLMTLKRLMDNKMGYRILDPEKRQIYFLKYPKDKNKYIRGLIR